MSYHFSTPLFPPSKVNHPLEIIDLANNLKDKPPSRSESTRTPTYPNWIRALPKGRGVRGG
jgi:hypothetical protein